VKVQRSNDETRAAACEQVMLLVNACRRFDEGERLEYLTIASKLRGLVRHNPPHSYAVLAQVGLLNQPIFVASGADLTPENVLPEAKLTIMFSGPQSGGKHVPRLGEVGQTVPNKMLPLHAQIHRKTHGVVVRDGGRGRSFEEWWDQDVVRDVSGNCFSRSALVLKVANQDGGDHVDPKVDAMHYALTRSNSMGMFWGEDPYENPVPATIRQIGWEVHAMLYEHASDLLSLVAQPRPSGGLG